jgi:cell division inhibitor SepF
MQHALHTEENMPTRKKRRIQMKFFDSVRDFFAPQEDDSYESEPVRETRESRERREYRESLRESARERDIEEPSAREVREPSPIRESYHRELPERPVSKRDNKVVNIQATAQLQVVLVKPEVFTDAKQIADHLISKKTVVLNLETASAENKRRIIDFLVGVAYANGGSLKPVANLTYIITPYNVGFIGEDLVNELETNGVVL